MNNTLYCFENFGLRRIFALLVCCVPLMLSGCKETIDDSNFAIKTEMTAADFIDTADRFTMMRTLLKRVCMGEVEGASSLYSVLSARGNYTLFLPTDDAVTRFMAENGVASLEEMTDEQAQILGRCLKKLSMIVDDLGLKDGFRLISNKGAHACQSVEHLHIHILGGAQLTEKMG